MKRETEGARVQGQCEAVARESLQLPSVTSATKSPSNCSPLPKHLANAQLMSTDVVSHWRLIALPADWLIRQGGRDNTERKGEKKK